MGAFSPTLPDRPWRGRSGFANRPGGVAAGDAWNRFARGAKAMWELLQYRHRAWKYRLARDRAEIASAVESIRPGATVIDVGAHKGAYLYWLRQAAGPKGRVLAFEPQPQLSSYLERI